MATAPPAQANGLEISQTAPTGSAPPANGVEVDVDDMTDNMSEPYDVAGDGEQVAVRADEPEKQALDLFQETVDHWQTQQSKETFDLKWCLETARESASWDVFFVLGLGEHYKRHCQGKQQIDVAKVLIAYFREHNFRVR